MRAKAVRRAGKNGVARARLAGGLDLVRRTDASGFESLRGKDAYVA
jgi:hypothetical protein